MWEDFFFVLVVLKAIAQFAQLKKLQLADFCFGREILKKLVQVKYIVVVFKPVAQFAQFLFAQLAQFFCSRETLWIP